MSARRIQFAPPRQSSGEVVRFPQRPAALSRPGVNPGDMSVRVTHQGRVGMFDTPEELLRTLAEVQGRHRRARRRAAVRSFAGRIAGAFARSR